MEKEKNQRIAFSTPAVLPDGDGGFTPCPELLTEDEAIRYLRLDIDGPAKPGNTLRYYRERQKLKATRVGKKLLYTRKALDEFLDRMTKQSDHLPYKQDVHGA